MSALRERVRRFLGWWLAELAGLAPARGVEVETDLSKPVAEAAAAIERACAGRARVVVLRLPERAVLQRIVTLPLAAERNLAAVLGFEMDRHTPFKAEAVYYGFAPLRRDAAARTLQVALTAVPRRQVDPLVEALRAAGIQARSLRAGTARLDLAAGPASSARASRTRRWALAGLAAVSVAALLGVPIAHKLQAIASLEAEVEAVRVQAQLAQRAREEIARLAAAQGALLERRREQRAALEVLLDLTRLVPDGTWLSHLNVAGARVRLRGESGNATEVLGALEGSGAFHGASLDGSVTRDARSARERFALSARVSDDARLDKH